MRVFIPKPIPDIGLTLLQKAGFNVTVLNPERSLAPEALIAACQQADAFLVSGSYKLDEAFLTACSHLKVIALFGVGYDNVDMAAATRLGIPVGNTPGIVTGATADIAFLLMQAVARKAFYMHKIIINGAWGGAAPKANLGVELNGKTLGIFGMGSIGSALARKCKGAFDMPVIYHNRKRNEEAEKTLGAVYVSLEDLLRQSDVLSLHANLTPETTGLFDRKAFAAMKPSSIFINTARGGMHNEQDLTQALQAGTIWGAGLDVTNPEPMHKDNLLLNMPNVAVLPHIGTATVETRDGMAAAAAANIIAGLRGQRLPHTVNPEVYTISKSNLEN